MHAWPAASQTVAGLQHSLLPPGYTFIPPAFHTCPPLVKWPFEERKARGSQDLCRCRKQYFMHLRFPLGEGLVCVCVWERKRVKEMAAFTSAKTCRWPLLPQINPHSQTHMHTYLHYVQTCVHTCVHSSAVILSSPSGTTLPCHAHPHTPTQPERVAASHRTGLSKNITCTGWPNDTLS